MIPAIGLALYAVGYVVSWSIPYVVGRRLGRRWSLGAAVAWGVGWMIIFWRAGSGPGEAFGIALVPFVPWALAAVIGSSERRRLRARRSATGPHLT